MEPLYEAGDEASKDLGRGRVVRLDRGVLWTDQTTSTTTAPTTLPAEPPSTQEATTTSISLPPTTIVPSTETSSTTSTSTTTTATTYSILPRTPLPPRPTPLLWPPPIVECPSSSFRFVVPEPWWASIPSPGTPPSYYGPP